MNAHKSHVNFAPSQLLSIGTQNSMTPIKLAAAKSVLPIFGGTSPEAKPEEKLDEKPDEKPTESAPAGGETPKDPAAELAKNPAAIADLLKQVADLTKNSTDTAAELKKYKDEEEKNARASQTREQNLEKDLATAVETIEKMDAVIQHVAKINAIQGYKDAQFHSARQVMNELQDGAYDLTVDLEKGEATISGMDKELARIAKDCHWLVVDPTKAAPAATPGIPGRSTGGAPGAPAGSTSKQTRRDELMGRFNVLTAGRTPMSK